MNENLVYVEDMVILESDYFAYAEDYSDYYGYEDSVPDNDYYDEEGNYIEPEFVCFYIL